MHNLFIAFGLFVCVITWLETVVCVCVWVGVCMGVCTTGGCRHTEARLGRVGSELFIFHFSRLHQSCLLLTDLSKHWAYAKIPFYYYYLFIFIFVSHKYRCHIAATVN